MIHIKESSSSSSSSSSTLDLHVARPSPCYHSDCHRPSVLPSRSPSSAAQLHQVAYLEVPLKTPSAISLDPMTHDFRDSRLMLS
ncbi:hypothetical protein E2C01_008774 [Portunus trituberculatus]|uniref:Uncharacterized protein n=1 Tax=Portunus trituberculatus TaxID=210409 RepID=A0A5B7D390_PORTR|nr:hypothetical protein [Portunus trituberculatus]